MSPRSFMKRVFKFMAEEQTGFVGSVLEFADDVLGAVPCALTFGLWCPDPLQEVASVVLGIMDAIDSPGTTTSLAYLYTSKSSSSHEFGHNLGMVDPLCAQP